MPSGSIKPRILPAVIKRDGKTLDRAGCLVKCRRNGRRCLCLRTFKDVFHPRLQAVYYGVLKLEEDSSSTEEDLSSTASEVEFRVRKRIIESDEETACYQIILNRKLQNRLIQKVPDLNRSSVFNDKSVFYVATCDGKVIEASFDEGAIFLKLSTLSESVLQGCPIYDANMQVVGLVNRKNDGAKWSVSWVTLRSGMLSFAILFCIILIKCRLLDSLCIANLINSNLSCYFVLYHLDQISIVRFSSYC